MVGGERGRQLAEILNGQRRVDGHIEDRGGERKPGFLKAPEPAERAADPDVEAAFLGHGRGEFADHEGGGQAPDEGNDGQ